MLLWFLSLLWAPSNFLPSPDNTQTTAPSTPSRGKPPTPSYLRTPEKVTEDHLELVIKDLEDIASQTSDFTSLESLVREVPIKERGFLRSVNLKEEIQSASDNIWKGSKFDYAERKISRLTNVIKAIRHFNSPNLPQGNKELTCLKIVIPLLKAVQDQGNVNLSNGEKSKIFYAAAIFYLHLIGSFKENNVPATEEIGDSLYLRYNVSDNVSRFFKLNEEDLIKNLNILKRALASVEFVRSSGSGQLSKELQRRKDQGVTPIVERIAQRLVPDSPQVARELFPPEQPSQQA